MALPDLTVRIGGDASGLSSALDEAGKRACEVRIVGLACEHDAADRAYARARNQVQLIESEIATTRHIAYTVAVKTAAQELRTMIGDLTELAARVHEIARQHGVDGFGEANTLFPPVDPRDPLTGFTQRSQEINVLNAAIQLYYCKVEYGTLQAA